MNPSSSSPNPSAQPPSTAPVQQPAAAKASGPNMPPVVPARPRPASNYDMNSYNNYNMYNGYSSPFANPLMSSFGQFGMGAYNGLGYNGLGFNRLGYGPYGAMNQPESDLIRLAEERSRTAFQSIESFVHAFQSISMMLESSYMALASSFRAVLGVAEHFSRLRMQIGSIITGLAIFRTFRKYLYNMMVYVGILRGETIGEIEERAWQQSSKAEQLANENTLTPELISQSSKSTWPIVAFFAVALGTPYVVYNVLKNVAKDHVKMESNRWAKGEGEHFVAIANFDFVGEGGHYNGDRHFKELSFKSGDKLFIAPKELQRAAKGWLLASLNNKIGLVPFNYLSAPIRVNNQVDILRENVQPIRPTTSNESEC